MVGLGKMGLSHLAILRTHPLANIVAGCDATTYLTDGLSKHANLKCYNDYDRLLDSEDLDAIVIATPSKSHASMVEKALQRGLHVFCEKPFVLQVEDGQRLVELADQKHRVTQVGYHYRFVGAFQEAARVVKSGALGRIHHIRAEAFGPVVLRPKGGTWRSSKTEGGGALYDYACHAVDLIHFVHQAPEAVSGVVRQPVFSRDVDDEVYSTLHFSDGSSGQLSVNWSDESYRKMATKVSIWGTNGRIVVDRQECQVYMRSPAPELPDYQQGWTVKYTTELTKEVWFYLRGEEYSAQIDHFFCNIRDKRMDGENSFRSALEADRVVAMLLDSDKANDSRRAAMAAEVPQTKKGAWSRWLSR
jgi:predicted dehydrogenase